MKNCQLVLTRYSAGNAAPAPSCAVTVPTPNVNLRLETAATAIEAYVCIRVCAFCMRKKHRETHMQTRGAILYTAVAALLVHLVGSRSMLRHNHSSHVHMSSHARSKHEKLEQFI